MAKDSVSSLLTSVDELFTTQEEREIAQRETVMDIPLSEISDFPNHPFKVTVDEKMLEMADSVKRYGVLVPAIVRPKQDGGYEMIAGHRRKMASELAERPTLNCIVRNLTDDEAIIIMVDSNLQREVIFSDLHHDSRRKDKTCRKRLAFGNAGKFTGNIFELLKCLFLFLGQAIIKFIFIFTDKLNQLFNL